MFLELVAEVLDGEAGDGLGYESGAVPLGQMQGLAFDCFEPEVGVLSTDVRV